MWFLPKIEACDVYAEHKDTYAFNTTSLLFIYIDEWNIALALHRLKCANSKPFHSPWI